MTVAPASPTTGHDRPGAWLPMWRVVGAIFVAYPVVRIVVDPPGLDVAILALGATALFAAVILAVARRGPDDPRRRSLVLAGLEAGLLALATATVLRSPDQGWFTLFYYGSTAASMLLPERRAIGFIVLAGILTALTMSISQDAVSAFIQGLSVTVIGITVFAMTALRRTNQQLHAARRELATRAVADERDRISRDLHDVLGHSLSLIAIKSELAGRLLPGDPERARAEIADVERVARESLASVRDTVSGSRQPTLARELESARLVLDAAGIDSTIDDAAGVLPEADDAVLAWALREAVTNVVRHSSAHHVDIRTRREDGEATIDVIDDGSGTDLASPADAAGTGLRGLGERLQQAGGHLDARPRPAGGFHLRAAVPIRSGGSTATADPGLTRP